MDRVILSLVSIAVGALLGGIVNAYVARYAAFRESKGIAHALKAEIEAVLALLVERDYAGDLDKRIERLQNPGYVPTRFDLVSILVTQDFFTIFHAVAEKIGLLDGLSGRITRFYVLAKGLLENLRTSRDLWERVEAGGPVPPREVLLNLNCQMRGEISLLAKAGEAVIRDLETYTQRRFREQT